MKGFLGKMGLAVLVLLGLGAVSFLSVWLFHRRSDTDPGEHALVLPPLPDDHAAESLKQIGSSIRFWGDVAYDDFRCEKQGDLVGIFELNRESLTAFWDWYHQGGRQALAPLTEAPNRARYPIFDWVHRRKVAPPIVPVRLSRLLLLQAYLEYQAGRHEAGRDALIATFELAHFLLQNADPWLAGWGYAILDRSQYFLAELAPAAEWDYEWAPLLASRDLFLGVSRKEGWLSAVGLHQEVADLSRDIKGKSAVLGFLTYSEGHTRYLIDHAQETFQRDIVRPIDHVDFNYFGAGQSFNQIGFNPAGRYSLSGNFFMLEKTLVQHGLITARGDILRVRLALHQAGLPWQCEHVTGQIQSLGLRNPFSGQPYQVEPSGDIVVFARTDSRWHSESMVPKPWTGMVRPDLSMVENPADASSQGSRKPAVRRRRGR